MVGGSGRGWLRPKREQRCPTALVADSTPPSSYLLPRCPQISLRQGKLREGNRKIETDWFPLAGAVTLDPRFGFESHEEEQLPQVSHTHTHTHTKKRKKKEKKRISGKSAFFTLGKRGSTSLCPALIFSHLQLRVLWCALQHDTCQSPELNSKSPCSESCSSSPCCPATASCCQLGLEPGHVAGPAYHHTHKAASGQERTSVGSHPAAKRWGSGGHV